MMDFLDEDLVSYTAKKKRKVLRVFFNLCKTTSETEALLEFALRKSRNVISQETDSRDTTFKSVAYLSSEKLNTKRDLWLGSEPAPSLLSPRNYA